MKFISCQHLFLILVLLAGCVSNRTQSGSTYSNEQIPVPPNTQPMPSPTQLSTISNIPTLITTWTPPFTPPTPTVTSTPTQTPTMTSLPTLEPNRVKATLEKRLAEPMDCEAPCFWGIVPGQTTLAEVKDLSFHLGLEMIKTQTNIIPNTDAYDIGYDFDSGLSISLLLRVKYDLVKNMRVFLDPEKYQEGVPRAWLAYSPETLIERYGTPSSVDVWVSMGPSGSPRQYAIDMYFEPVEMIISYEGYDPPYMDGLFHICPLTDDFDFIRIWLGQNPVYPPNRTVPLEESASITLEEFAELITGDPENACIEVKKEAYPQGN